jgi:HEPN domain-containing protein
MKPETAEWIEKAEGDFRTAQREKGTAEYPNYDATCFHAQQSAEKYLKARLIEAGKDFPKTHDLSAILNLVLPFEPLWEAFREELERLTDLGIEVRYPGTTADLEDAAEALHTARRIRQIVRETLKVEK